MWHSEYESSSLYVYKQYLYFKWDINLVSKWFISLTLSELRKGLRRSANIFLLLRHSRTIQLHGTIVWLLKDQVTSYNQYNKPLGYSLFLRISYIRMVLNYHQGVSKMGAYECYLFCLIYPKLLNHQIWFWCFQFLLLTMGAGQKFE